MAPPQPDAQPDSWTVEAPPLEGTVELIDTDCCGSPYWWGRVEYLGWWTQGMKVPALATSGDAADALPAALGEPGTQVLFGNSTVNSDARSGGQFTLGKWFDACQNCGVEVSYLVLGEESTNFAASDADFAVLGRPFFNTVTNLQDARLIADPGAVSGTLGITTRTEFQSLEALYRWSRSQSQYSRMDWLLGYRFTELQDRVRIDESMMSLAGPTTGTTIDLFDQFDVRNTFHGAQGGFQLQWQVDQCWSWEATAKLALGASVYRADVAGQTTTTDNAGNVSTAQGGLLALGTNSGPFRWEDFAALSEFGVTARRQLHSGLTMSFGYSFVYLSHVARAGEQIDTTVNPTQIPPGNLVGDPRPAFPFRTTDFWAQGLRLGLEYSF